MIKPEVKNRINWILIRNIEKAGLKYSLAAEDYLDDDGDVPIPREMANEHNEVVIKIVEELRNSPDVVSVYDRGAGRKIIGDDYRQIEFKVKEGCWVRTQADADKEEKEMRGLEDFDFMENTIRQDRLKNWKEFLLPVPKKIEKPYSTELYLTLAYEPYDWIKAGEKVTEFRAYTARYNERLLGRDWKTVKFQRGYGGKGRGKPEQMVFEIKRIRLYDCMTRKLTDPYHPEPIVPTHFAIDLGKRIR